MRKVKVVAALLALTACARVLPPPGGVRDEEPPRIIETDPAQNAPATQHAGTDRPVRIIFHETLSERGPREMVQVSPETGEVEVDRDGNELRITIAGGWQRGRVYQITVLPGLLDRHGNARTSAYGLLFSTGPPILPNAVGGLVTDRITGRAVANARVEAISRGDSTVYTTVTDTAGFFALRSLPVGAYAARVYVDQNRNRELDRFEARATRDLNVNSADTIAVDLALLAPDTTPARLLRAEIRDSLQVRLFFDDYMDPSGALPPMRITAWQLPDSTMMTGGSVMTPREFQRLAADTARVPPQITPQLVTDTARVLPINELVWRPAVPLRHGMRYRINLTGYINLAGLPNGGGSVIAVAPAAPRPAAPRPAAPAPRDTTSR